MSVVKELESQHKAGIGNSFYGEMLQLAERLEAENDALKIEIKMARSIERRLDGATIKLVESGEDDDAAERNQNAPTDRARAGQAAGHCQQAMSTAVCECGRCESVVARGAG